MKTLLKGILAGTALGAAALLVNTAPASAQIARAPAALGIDAASSLVTEVQYRRGWRGHGPRYHHRHYHGRRGWGPGPAVGVGIAAGAIIGSAIAAQAARANEVHAYCASRYRSYDPASGTYLGYDGLRHPCP